ncbi:MAG: hypothetical protein IJ960_04315 [Oscillospiraceae bacterium]|nr:hypothetical protein [Oscillospiraceae bacterium]
MKFNRSMLLWGIGLLLASAAIVWGGGELLLALAVPFTALCKALRSLSLMSAAGNTAALALYWLICFSPLLLLRRKQKLWVNLLPVIGCAVLFRVLWLMVNPDMMPGVMRNDLGKAIYAGAVYSVLLTWSILKLMTSPGLTDSGKVYHALGIFLTVCAWLFLLEGFGLGLSRFLSGLKALKAEQTALTSAQLLPSRIFLALDYILGAAEGLGLGWLLLLGRRLVKEIAENPFSEACHMLCGKIILWCRRIICLLAAANLGMNLGQVLLAGKLVNVDLILRLPVLSLAVAFCLMALSCLLDQGKELKDDNDLFI